jgi:POT family proton-dependent oligopeptide transporter
MAEQTSSGQLTIDQIQNFEGKYPKQLWYLFLSEMWERFSFYGMRGMLTIFMVEKLLLNEKEANLQYGATQAFVYTLAFVGGLFADKILGFRKSIFWGGILMIIGSFTLACMPANDPHNLFYLGISFTIVGTGFFKPNISTMVGRLYKSGDVRKDAGFGLFYSGINVGALLGGWACIHVANTYSWNAAFSLAGIVMSLSLIIFIFTKKTLGPIGLPPVSSKITAAENALSDQLKLGAMEAPATTKAITTKDLLVYGGSLLSIPLILILVSNSQYTNYFMYTVGPLTLLYIFYEMSKYNTVERQKLAAALIFIIFSIFFWAFFEQAGGSLSLFARYNLGHQVLGFNFDPNEVNNSSNSFFVILFSPLVGLLWPWLSKRKIEPNTVVKFGLGFLFVSLSFYIFYYTRFFAGADGKTSLNVFTLAYLVTTIGELCLSPIGLSIMTSLSPKPLHGVMMGMWFLASAYGQYAAGLLGAGMATANENASLMDKLLAYTEGYKHLALYALISGIVLIAISPLVRKLMHEVH